MRKTAWMFAAAIALISVPVMAADGDAAATPPEQQLSWARWQGRLSLGASATASRLGADSPSFRLPGASVMGDYYFGRPLAASAPIGGFRATSGLIFGSRSILSTGQPSSLAGGSAFSIGTRLLGPTSKPSLAEATGDSSTLPYLGFGYTGLSVRSGWSFNADLGLVAQSPGNAARLGRVFGGGQSLDDVIRDMRLAPLLQLGVSYSF